MGAKRESGVERRLPFLINDIYVTVRLSRSVSVGRGLAGDPTVRFAGGLFELFPCDIWGTVVTFLTHLAGWRAA